MVKVRGVILYPSRVDELLSGIEGVSSEYQVMIDHLDGRDILTLFFESPLAESAFYGLERTVEALFKERIGVTPVAKAVKLGDLPRSEKKTTRIFDNRY